MHNSIAAKKSQIAVLCREYGVRRLEVFGSAARGHDFDPQRSDADFLVSFDPHSTMSPLGEFFGLQAALADLIGQRVDLVEAGATKNPFVCEMIERDRELLYTV